MVIVTKSGDDGPLGSRFAGAMFGARIDLQSAFPAARSTPWRSLYKILDNYHLSYIIRMVKAIHFVGSSLQDLRAFPATTRREVGYQLGRVQDGLEPSDWKPIKPIGRGVREIRVQQEGQYRVIYIAKHTIYVLHASQKKTRKISNQDVETARQRLRQVQEKRKWSR